MKLSIHIIDNNKVYRRILEECLIALGYSNIKSFGNPDEILNSESNPDIIILDHEMGNSGLSGLEFFRLYGHTKFRQTKFIFLSSNTDNNTAISAIRLGAFDYIIKSKKGLDRMVNVVGKLVKAKRENYRKRKILRAACISLSIISLFFVLAIYIYNHSVL